MAGLTAKQLERAIRAKAGNITEVASALGISRTAVYKRINNNPRLQQALADSREELLDLAESALREMVKEHNTAAVIFALKTVGKERGYVEKQLVDVTTKGQMLKTYVGISPDDWDDGDDGQAAP